MQLDHYRTLLLDSSYRPIKVISWQRAIELTHIQDKVVVVEEYDRKIRSPSCEFTLPAVIALKQYLRYRPLRVRYSKRNVFLRDDHQCQYCGAQLPKSLLTLDHVFPRSRGGRSTWENSVTACEPCNHRKSDRTPEEARMPLRAPPSRPHSSARGFILTPDTPEEWRHYLQNAG